MPEFWSAEIRGAGENADVGRLGAAVPPWHMLKDASCLSPLWDQSGLVCPCCGTCGAAEELVRREVYLAWVIAVRGDVRA